MNKENELTFQITMTLVEQLLKNRQITQAEYEIFKEKMIQKYQSKFMKLMHISLDK